MLMLYYNKTKKILEILKMLVKKENCLHNKVEFYIALVCLVRSVDGASDV